MDQTLQSSGMAAVFPVYDAHGNNVATLSRNGLGYQVSNRRSFDAWGSVRLGSQTGDPTGRYCANLGHKQDDESGLVYMRARYYEPTSGRFLSQDPARDGLNWFTYARNNPVSLQDRSGKEAEMDFSAWAFCAVLWYSLVPAPGAENPALRGALSDFCGFSVADKWVDRLKHYLDPYFANTTANILGLVSWMIGDTVFRDGVGKVVFSGSVLSRGLAVVSIAEAWAFMQYVALVGCDMAFEEGL